jgi:hypothetical protein
LERGQKHPQTNVLKYWPWLEDDTTRQVLLIQLFGSNTSRRALTAWTAQKMAETLGDRFTYVARDLPMTPADYEELCTRLTLFRSGSR